MRAFIKILTEIGKVPITLEFFRSAAVSSSSMSYSWTGHIEEIEWDDVAGGYLIFVHTPTEAKRLQVETTYLNLSSIVIWAIDIKVKDFDDGTYLECPHCDGIVRLQEADKLDRVDLEGFENYEDDHTTEKQET